MRYFTCKGRGVGLTFLAPDAGGASGGEGKSDGGPSNGGAADLEKLFSDIPFDELDSKTQQALTKAKESVKTQFATLQSKVADPKEKERLDKLEKEVLPQLQRERDTFRSQLQKLTGGDPSHTPTEDEYLTAAENTLRTAKFSEEEIKKQAPIYAELLKGQLKVFRKEFGRDMGPMVGTVLFQEARSSFEEAQERDSTGVLDVPEVAEKVWQQIQGRAKEGQPSNADLVLNLAKIAWHDYTAERKEKGEEVPNLRSTPKSGKTDMSTGGFTFPGSGRVSGATHSVVRNIEDPNASKNPMNADTEAAVEATFRDLYRTTGVAPKNLKPKFEKTVRK